VTDLSTALGASAAAVNKLLEELIPEPEGPEGQLLDAMRYAVLAGGKRLRPYLVMASADLFAVPESYGVRAAAAVEMVHAYSLIHDDLPCMDDDDMRRGKPTVHKRFDEATAVLAGDALLTEAFEVLAHEETHPDPTVRNELVLALARAAGHHGMVGGQMIDLMAETQSFEAGQITRLQQLKTGALIAYSCEAGAILGRADQPERHALHAYAHDLGLAFQITDDLLDAEGDADAVGKAVGKDEDSGKATLVSLIGPEQARTQAGMLSKQAIAHLDLFGKKADSLRVLAEFVVNRNA
jgi:farnesyl diphosphate synthase